MFIRSSVQSIHGSVYCVHGVSVRSITDDARAPTFDRNGLDESPGVPSAIHDVLNFGVTVLERRRWKHSSFCLDHVLAHFHFKVIELLLELASGFLHVVLDPIESLWRWFGRDSNQGADGSGVQNS